MQILNIVVAALLTYRSYTGNASAGLNSRFVVKAAYLSDLKRENLNLKRISARPERQTDRMNESNC